MDLSEVHSQQKMLHVLVEINNACDTQCDDKISMMPPACSGSDFTHPSTPSELWMKKLLLKEPAWFLGIHWGALKITSRGLHLLMWSLSRTLYKISDHFINNVICCHESVPDN